MKRPLLQVRIVVLPLAEESVAELLTDVAGMPASAWTDARTGRTTVMVHLAGPESFNADRRARLRAGLRHLRDCGIETGAARITTRRIRHEDWAESWKRHFRPLEFGRTLLVRPSWSRRRARRGQAVLTLDPGLSFGTGQHPTTRFCLGQIVASHERGDARTLLDIGTGSGILALAAARLGFRRVDAFDFDPVCLRVSRANADANGLATAVHFRRQDLRQLPARAARDYDIVCANLTSDLLVGEAGRITARLAPAGTLVVAGILRRQFPEVRAALGRRGFRLVARQAEGEWQSGAFRRGTPRALRSARVAPAK